MKQMCCFNLVGGLALSLMTIIVWWHWEWVVSSSGESGSTILRNLGLVYGGLIAIWVAVWRGVVADRQAEASNLQAQSSLEQAKAAQDQAETSQHVLLNERYQRGAQMLGSPVLAVRLGGIYALERLAEEEPDKYHVQIMELFCAFVTEPFREKDKDETGSADQIDEKLRQRNVRNLVMALLVPKDVQAVLTAFRDRSGTDIKIEKKASFIPNLSHAELRGANLSDVNLSGADLSYAVFAPPNKTHVNEEVIDSLKMPIVTANLSGADLRGAILFETDLEDANLTGADLRGAVNLSQDQLDHARADDDNPPKLDDDYEWTGGEPFKVPAIDGDRCCLKHWNPRGRC